MEGRAEDARLIAEEVVVTATRVGRAADEVPQAVTVVDEAWIARQTPSLLPDLLRGQTGSSILLLVDGMRLNTAFFRPAPNQYFALVDPYNVERLEVLRGAGSTLYGSDAIGGVVQVFTPEARFESDGWSTGGRLLQEYVSTTSGSISRVEAAVGRRGVSLAGGATLQFHGDLDGGGATGRQSPSGYGVVAGDAKLLLDADAQDVMLAAQYLRQPETPRYDALVPGFGQEHPESAVFLFSPNDRLIVHGRYRLFDLLPGAEQMELHLAWQRIDDDRTTREFDASAEEREHNRSSLFGATAQAVAAWRDWMTLTYGVDLYLDRVASERSSRDTASGEGAPRPGRFPDGSRQWSVGLYVEDEIVLAGDLHAVAGLRFSSVGVDLPEVAERSPAVRRNLTNVSGNLGLKYRAARSLALVFNAGRGFRAPNVFDYAQLGARPGNRFAEPNPDLGPETAFSIDLGAKISSASWRAETFGFGLWVDDKIEAIPTGAARPDGRAVVRSENVNRVTYAGVESGVRHLPPWGGELYGSLNYTWGEERLASGELAPADRVPPVNGQIGGVFPLLPAAWVEPFVHFAGRQDRLSRRDQADPRIDPSGTAAWMTINVRWGYRLAPWLEARATFENLLDRQYRIHGSGIDAAGIGFSMALEGRWW